MIRRLPSAAVMERKTFKPAWNIRIPDAVEFALLMIAVGPNSSLFKLDILSIATLNKMCRRYFFNIQIRTWHPGVSRTAIKPSNIHKLKAVSTTPYF